jgi:(R,R)-butanediol dehydrogenase/meso-butanediol dehydrogenase/diacetyl reductase
MSQRPSARAELPKQFGADALINPRDESNPVGVNERPTPITPTTLMFGEIDVKGYLAWDHKDFKIAVDFMASGQVDVKPLISDVIALADIQTKGFERLKGDKSLVKLLVKP